MPTHVSILGGASAGLTGVPAAVSGQIRAIDAPPNILGSTVNSGWVHVRVSGDRVNPDGSDQYEGNLRFVGIREGERFSIRGIYFRNADGTGNTIEAIPL
jgi:hypothetical protein